MSIIVCMMESYFSSIFDDVIDDDLPGSSGQQSSTILVVHSSCLGADKYHSLTAEVGTGSYLHLYQNLDPGPTFLTPSLNSALKMYDSMFSPI
jgi:hypothetical protein